MPAAALKVFQTDMARARALLAHAAAMTPSDSNAELLRDDVLRSAWMFGVGAMDTYFCDAYADLLAGTLICKSNHPSTALPSFLDTIKIPIKAVLEEYPERDNWKWRMAIRAMMETENALNLDAFRSRLNKFIRSGRLLYHEILATWVAQPGAPYRLFRVSAADIATAMSKGTLDSLKIRLNVSFMRRIESIIQRRHDCIHTCDRPNNKPQPIGGDGTVKGVLDDIEYVVTKTEDHLANEFSFWLRSTLKFPAAIAARVGY